MIHARALSPDFLPPAMLILQAQDLCQHAWQGCVIRLPAHISVLNWHRRQVHSLLSGHSKTVLSIVHESGDAMTGNNFTLTIAEARLQSETIMMSQSFPRVPSLIRRGELKTQVSPARECGSFPDPP